MPVELRHKAVAADAIHNDRAVVLEFDYWMIGFGRYARESQRWSFVEAIVDSFRFTDSE